MFKLQVSSAARNDIAESVLWYNKQQEGLGNEFLREVYSSLNHIAENPFLFPIRFSGKFRFSKINRFPFLVVYEITDESVFINAVFHTSQNPSRF